MIGDVYHGWLEPGPTPGYALLRVAVTCVLTVVGVAAGLRLQRYLRDDWRIILFGYDPGTAEDREPSADQDGALFLCVCATCLAWWVGLMAYAKVLPTGKQPHSGMHDWDYAFFNLILAGLFTFFYGADRASRRSRWRRRVERSAAATTGAPQVFERRLKFGHGRRPDGAGRRREAGGGARGALSPRG